jgi:hypothetical protein
VDVDALDVVPAALSIAASAVTIAHVLLEKKS